jgi:hypothetical protein
MNATPEDFAAGARQALGKAPIMPSPSVDYDAWLAQIDHRYPPARDSKTSPLAGQRPSGDPLHQVAEAGLVRSV